LFRNPSGAVYQLPLFIHDLTLLAIDHGLNNDCRKDENVNEISGYKLNRIGNVRVQPVAEHYQNLNSHKCADNAANDPNCPSDPFGNFYHTAALTLGL